MYIEDYQIKIIPGYRYGQSEETFLSMKDLASFIICKQEKVKFRDYAGYIGFGANKRHILIDTANDLENNLLHISIKIQVNSLPKSRIAFLKEGVREIGNTYEGREIIWHCNKKDAIRLDIYKALKEFDRPIAAYQKKYAKVIKDAYKLVNISQPNYEELVTIFLEDRLISVYGLGIIMNRFYKDCKRRVQQLAKLKTKESASKFAKYLNNCPKSYVDYRK